MVHLRTTRRVSRIRTKSGLFLGLLAIAIDLGGAAGAEPERSPARLVPADGLTAYLEYDGLGAHADAWKATAAHAILNETTAGELIASAMERSLDYLLKLVPGNKTSGRDILAVQAHIVRHGFAIASLEREGKTTTVTVLNRFTDRPVRESFDRVLRFLLHLKDDEALPTPNRVRNRNIYAFNDRFCTDLPFSRIKVPRPGLSWWREGDRLVIVHGPESGFLEGPSNAAKPETNLADLHRARVGEVLDTIEGKISNATAHPAYQAASVQGRDLGGFSPVGLFFADARKGEAVLDAFQIDADSAEGTLLHVTGLVGTRRVIGRWGSHGKALLTDVRFDTSEPWKGLAGMADPAGLRKEHLPPLPRGMGLVAIGALGGGDLGAILAPVQSRLKPETVPLVEGMLRVIHEGTTPELRGAILRQLGPVWSAYAAPDAEDKNAAVPAFLIGVRDSEAFSKALDATAARLNEYFRRLGTDEGNEPKPGDPPPALALERLPVPERGYRLTSPARSAPWLSDATQPTVLVGKSFVAIAENPERARAALAGETRPEDRWMPRGELAASLGCLPSKLDFLCVGNPRDSSWPEMIAHLPQTKETFLALFAGLRTAEEPQGEKPSDVLGLLGIPRPAGPRVMAPSADELRARIFPSVLAAVVEPRSVRVISVEALPFACVGVKAKYVTGTGGQKLEINPSVRPGQ